MMVIYLIGLVWLFVDIHSILLMPLIIWLLFYIVVVIRMVPPVRNRSAALSEAISMVTGRIVDSYTNIQAVKLFAHHDLEDDFAADGIRIHTKAFHRMMRLILNMTVALTILNTVLIVSVAALSLWLWFEQSITLGEIAVVNGLVIRLNHMSGWILRTITSLFENVGVVQNGMETIAKPQQIIDTPNAQDLLVKEGRIEFDRVSFAYQNANENNEHAITGSATVRQIPTVIEGCSLTIEAGERVGLVGVSGAGKSTLINLLMRFHEVDVGEIRIDGQSLASVTQDSLRRQMYAAEAAAAAEFIPDLVDTKGRRGLDALVGERGVKLSGGQRQRIAIARVMLKNAPILILDEATSALDSDVEAAIQQKLDQLMHGKTVLAVAHRLSTIASLDRLVVLQAGQIVESGTHQQLIDHKGVYYRLWTRQSGGFLGQSG